jgi:hypothetical protein
MAAYERQVVHRYRAQRIADVEALGCCEDVLHITLVVEFRVMHPMTANPSIVVGLMQFST